MLSGFFNPGIRWEHIYPFSLLVWWACPKISKVLRFGISPLRVILKQRSAQSTSYLRLRYIVGYVLFSPCLRLAQLFKRLDPLLFSTTLSLCCDVRAQNTQNVCFSAFLFACYSQKALSGLKSVDELFSLWFAAPSFVHLRNNLQVNETLLYGLSPQEMVIVSRREWIEHFTTLFAIELFGEAYHQRIPEHRFLANLSSFQEIESVEEIRNLLEPYSEKCWNYMKNDKRFSALFSPGHLETVKEAEIAIIRVCFPGHGRDFCKMVANKY